MPGKRKGQHPVNALSAVQVRNLKTPGKYPDGNCLYLIVEKSLAKHWLLRLSARGKRHDLGLGSASLVPLAEAREKAIALRRVARDGGDVLEAHRKGRTITPSFEEAARAVHAELKPSWVNPKHAAQWLNTLVEYAFPTIGTKRVDHVDTPDIKKVLSLIWLEKPETARRVRQRIRTVLDWAKAEGYRTGENPVEGVEKGLPKQPKRNGHHSALPHEEVPEFIGTLRDNEANTPANLAFEFLILTAARTGEVIGAVWDEIDTDKKTWTIPAGRMKGKVEHRVPLSARCLEIIEKAKRLSNGSNYVFAGHSPDKSLSNMVFLMALRRMETKVTAHGFRSSFRDWASEKTNFPNHVCEQALAHAVPDRVEAAYRRGDLFDKRRDLMDAWAAFTASASADVIPLPVGQRQ